MNGASNADLGFTGNPGSYEPGPTDSVELSDNSNDVFLRDFVTNAIQ